MKKTTVRYLLISVIVLVLFVSSVTLVDQRETVLVLQMGAVARVLDHPGVYLQVPLLQTSVQLDRRGQTLEEDRTESYPTADHKPLALSCLIRWHISDPRVFYARYGTDPNRVQNQLHQNLDAALGLEIAHHERAQVPGAAEGPITQAAMQKVNAQGLGLVVDEVRWQRISLPTAAMDAVISSQRAETRASAQAIRNRALAQAQAIKDEANRAHEAALAANTKEIDAIKTQTDDDVAAIYNVAYAQDPEFYRFYRSLETYRASFAHRSDVLVLHTDSDLLRYLQPPGKGKP